MSRIELEAFIAAPIERVFDLARSIDAHVASTPGTNERPIAGRMSGLIELGEEVTWRARHFGINQQLTARITAFDRPHHFRDTMVRGSFSSFEHDHLFEPAGDRTRCRDVFDFIAPLGPIGRVVDRLVLGRYMRRFLQTRLDVLKTLAEGEGWREFLR